jgi:hypothetical protein
MAHALAFRIENFNVIVKQTERVDPLAYNTLRIFIKCAVKSDGDTLNK